MGFLKARIQQLANLSHGDKEYDLTLHRLGELVTTDSNGKYYMQNYNGNLFYGTTTNAGVAIPADNATAQTFGVWNPAGSGKVLVPVHLRLGIVTLGTRVVSSIQFNFLANAGATIATGSPITAWTDTTPQTSNIGSYNKSVMRFALAATTSAATSYWQTGLFHDLATGGAPPPFVVDFDGTLILQPNNAMFLQSTDAATGSTYAITMSWLELPL